MSADTNSLMERLPLLHGRVYRLWAESLSVKGTTWTFRHRRMTKSPLLPCWLLMSARIFPPTCYTASPHAMKNATGVPPERPFIYVSGAWRKSPGYSAGRSITKRHTVSCKLSRWDASVTHLISLPIQHVHSSRRCSCSQLHTSLSLPRFNL